jgi:hypothetical protein
VDQLVQDTNHANGRQRRVDPRVMRHDLRPYRAK